MFLIRVLLPLHKVKSLSVYHPQVSCLPPDERGPSGTEERVGRRFSRNGQSSPLHLCVSPGVWFLSPTPLPPF